MTRSPDATVQAFKFGGGKYAEKLAGYLPVRAAGVDVFWSDAIILPTTVWTRAQHVVLGAFGVLVIASLIGFILARVVRTESGRATVANINARVKSWWGIVIVLF